MFADSQSPIVTPTPPIVDDEAGCGLRASELLKIKVSVWNKRTKDFLRALSYTDFEVRIDGEIRDIDYFIKPRDLNFSESLQDEYVVGLDLYDIRENKQREINVRVKPQRDTAGSLH